MGMEKRHPVVRGRDQRRVSVRIAGNINLHLANIDERELIVALEDREETRKEQQIVANAVAQLQRRELADKGSEFGRWWKQDGAIGAARVAANRSMRTGRDAAPNVGHAGASSQGIETLAELGVGLACGRRNLEIDIDLGCRQLLGQEIMAPRQLRDAPRERLGPAAFSHTETGRRAGLPAGLIQQLVGDGELVLEPTTPNSSGRRCRPRARADPARSSGSRRSEARRDPDAREAPRVASYRRRRACEAPPPWSIGVRRPDVKADP